MIMEFVQYMNNMIELISEKIVICGGGALIPQATALASEVFSVPAQIGLPTGVSGPENEISSPRFVTPIGLLRVGERLHDRQERTGLPANRESVRDPA